MKFIMVNEEHCRDVICDILQHHRNGNLHSHLLIEIQRGERRPDKVHGKIKFEPINILWKQSKYRFNPKLSKGRTPT